MSGRGVFIAQRENWTFDKNVYINHSLFDKGEELLHSGVHDYNEIHRRFRTVPTVTLPEL